VNENTSPGWIERQLFAEFRFLIFLIAGILFLWACASFAIWAGMLGTVGIVLLIIGLAILFALIVWELWLFARRYFPARDEPD
jgi:hypothetical protein